MRREDHGDISGCRCCTPLTRLYLLLSETRSQTVAFMQQALCALLASRDVDGVVLVRTPGYEEVGTIASCARGVARGVLVASHPLGILLMEHCDTKDEDSTRLEAIDTIVVEQGLLKCHLLYPRALASCIPRGYEALVAVRWRWQVKLLAAALARAGYKRVHVTGKKVDTDVIGLSPVYGIDIDIVSLDTARYYVGSVDVVIDAGVLGDAAPPEKTIHVGWDELTEETPCILSEWFTTAILLWENVFIERGEARAIISSLLHNRGQRRENQ